MGDISAEPSMEEILSSIKRIIAEEGDGSAGGRGGRRASMAAATRIGREPEEEILELRERVDAAREADKPLRDGADAARTEQKRKPVVSEPQEPAEDAESGADCAAAQMASRRDMEAILSARAAEASRGSLEALSRLIVKPQTAGAETLEGLVREMLRPMLSDWLDANLPQIVETMVAREIARITRNTD